MEKKTNWVKWGSITIVAILFVIFIFIFFSKCSDANNNAKAYWNLKKKDSLFLAHTTAHLDSAIENAKDDVTGARSMLNDSIADFTKQKNALTFTIGELERHVAALQKDSADRKAPIVSKGHGKSGRKFNKHINPKWTEERYNNCSCN